MTQNNGYVRENICWAMISAENIIGRKEGGNMAEEEESLCMSVLHLERLF